MATDEARREAAHGLFSLFDLDGNGAVGLHELMQVAQSSRRIGGAEKHSKRLRKLEAEIRNAVNTNKKTGGSMTSIPLSSGGLVTFAASDGEPSLDPTAFVNFVVAMCADSTAEEFQQFVELSTAGVADALQMTQGSASRRTTWAMFQLLDENQDGFVDLAELETLLQVVSKNDRKHVAQWKAILAQKQLESQTLYGHAVLGSASAADAQRVSDALASVADGAVSLENTASTVSMSMPNSFDDRSLKLTLRDFQQFIAEYTDKNDQRVEDLHARVRESVQRKYDEYLSSMKVNDVLDAIVDDLIRERPHDVLDGIIRSCERLKRTGTYARSGLRRVQSTVRVRDPAAASAPSSAPTSARSEVKPM